MTRYAPLTAALGLEPQKNPSYLTDDIEKSYNPIISRQESISRNQEEHICDRCGITGKGPNMSRWHFDNCNTVLRECKHCKKTIPRQGIKDHLYNQKVYCNRKCYMESKKGKAPIVMSDEVKIKLSNSALERSTILSDRMKKNEVWLKSGRWKK